MSKSSRSVTSANSIPELWDVIKFKFARLSFPSWSTTTSKARVVYGNEATLLHRPQNRLRSLFLANFLSMPIAVYFRLCASVRKFHFRVLWVAKLFALLSFAYQKSKMMLCLCRRTESCTIIDTQIGLQFWRKLSKGKLEVDSAWMHFCRLTLLLFYFFALRVFRNFQTGFSAETLLTLLLYEISNRNWVACCRWCFSYIPGQPLPTFLCKSSFRVVRNLLFRLAGNFPSQGERQTRTGEFSK